MKHYTALVRNPSYRFYEPNQLEGWYSYNDCNKGAALQREEINQDPKFPLNTENVPHILIYKYTHI